MVGSLSTTLEQTAEDLKVAKQRVLMLEEELKRTKGLSHDLTQEMQIKNSEAHALKMKVKWGLMITTFVVQAAFPHNTDQLVQTDITPRREIAINTDLPTNVSEAVRHWSMVCRAAERIQLGSVDVSLRQTVQQLFAFISDSISKKVIADAIDEKAHQKKQTLPEYFGTWYLEETKSKEAAFAAETQLVANVRYWMAVANKVQEDKKDTKKAGGSDPKSKKGLATSKEQEEEKLRLLQCLPRLKLFARFLALEGGSGAETEHLPLDALNVYLALLVKIQKGSYPLLPEGCERVLVKTEDVLGAVDHVFYRYELIRAYMIFMLEPHKNCWASRWLGGSFTRREVMLWIGQDQNARAHGHSKHISGARKYRMFVCVFSPLSVCLSVFLPLSLSLIMILCQCVCVGLCKQASVLEHPYLYEVRALSTSDTRGYRKRPIVTSANSRYYSQPLSAIMLSGKRILLKGSAVQRDVALGRQDVDLDNALNWLLDRYMENIFRYHCTLYSTPKNHTLYYYLSVPNSNPLW